MSEEIPPDVLPRFVQDRKKKRPNTGAAVVNGKIRFTSVSQMKLFDEGSEGCPRKWVFQYVFRKKLADTTATTLGDNSASALEHYLKTGEDALPPLISGVKKYFPKPIAPYTDLDVEEPLALDLLKSIALREEYIRAPSELLAHGIQKYAGLSVANIPVDGAADCRHRRGVYADENGVIRKEHPDHVVVQILDLKTIKRIDSRRIMRGVNKGMVLQGYGKTPAELAKDIQLLGYGKDADNRYEGLTHVRLTHVYAQKESKAWAARSAFISVDEVRRRWKEDVEPVALDMEQHAGVTRIEDVRPNYSACDKYTHVDAAGEIQFGCGHRLYCPMSNVQVAGQMVGVAKSEGVNMLSLFDVVEGSVPAAPSAPVAPPTPPVDSATYQQQVDEARRALEAGNAPFGTCSDCGTSLIAQNSSRLRDGGMKHIGCPNANAVAPRSTGTVNPPNVQEPNMLEQAAAMSAENIAQVGDPAARARMTAHAAEHAVAAAAEASEKASGKAAGAVWCTITPVGTKVEITTEVAVAGKYTCACGKSWSLKTLKPIKENDVHVTSIPKHKPPKTEGEETAAPPPPAGPTITVTVEGPPAPLPPAPPVAPAAPVPPAPPAAPLPPPPPAAPTAPVAPEAPAAPLPPSTPAVVVPPLAPVVIASTETLAVTTITSPAEPTGEMTAQIEALFGKENGHSNGKSRHAVPPVVQQSHANTIVIFLPIAFDTPDIMRRFTIDRSTPGAAAILDSITTMLSLVEAK